MNETREEFMKLLYASRDFITNLKQRAEDVEDKRYFQGQKDAIQSIIISFDQIIVKDE